MLALTRAFALVPLIGVAIMDMTAHAAPIDQNLSPNLHSNGGFSLNPRGNVAEKMCLNPGHVVSDLRTKLGMARMSMMMHKENDVHEIDGRDVWACGAAMIEIREWLVALESYTVPELVAQDIIQMLFPSLSSRLQQPRERLAAMLSDEYVKLFDHYTGAPQEGDSLKRLARLVKRYGEVPYRQILLHKGFDWDFGKMQRGFIWEDAIENDKIPPMQDLESTPQDKMRLLADNTRKDLMQGLTNYILQIDSGRRGPVKPHVNQNLRTILRDLVEKELTHNQAVRGNREKPRPTLGTGMPSMIPEPPSEWHLADDPTISLDLLPDRHWGEDMGL